ncbi:sulfite exporter TauE/SafE family protein [Sulfurospirillum sp. 1307]|jgi:uncharacterized membrane protein YfcA
MLEYSIFFISALFHGVLGFGFPLIATPLLSIFLSVKEAVLLTLFPTLASNAKTIHSGENFAQIFLEYKLLIFPIILGSFLGTFFLVTYDVVYYRYLLAFVILLYLNKHLINLEINQVINKNPKKMMLVFGIISGIVSGLVNIMIPVLIIYILEAKIEKEKSVVLMNLCFLSSKLTQIIFFGSSGFFDFNFLIFILFGLVFTLVGLFIGQKLRDKIDEVLYKKILTIVLWIFAVYLLIS